MADLEKQQEQNRVDDVTAKIAKQIEKVNEDYQAAREEFKNVQQNYATNTSVNWFEVDDRIETSAELQQQRGLVSRLTENQNILEQQLETYKELEQSPYFGRIDVTDPGETTDEKLYIGTASFVDDDQNFLVYDWRAPISSIYYNGTLGDVTYETPAGLQHTRLDKKRQFLIQDGKITTMFDTSETVGDEMLQHVLGEQNDDKMQNIVATIQREQNDIIRDTRSDLLVVQGVAGSGKTSAILQRIAFLLYHSRAELEADQIVLFSPNRLFSHYISDVLPSLGERNMRQVTQAEFLASRLQGLTVETLFDRYESEQQQQTLSDAHQNYLESAAFIQAIDDYCQQVPSDQLVFNNILFRGEVFFSKEEIKRIYDAQPTSTPAQRFLRTKNQLIKQLKRRINQEAREDWVQEAVDQLNDEEYHALLGTKHLGEFQEVDAELNYIARKITAQRLRIVYDAIYNGYFLDNASQYEAFLKQCPYPETIAAEDWQAHLAQFDDNIENHHMQLIDAAPFLYLRDTLAGGGQNRAIQYLFVDEMQDYSTAELLYFRHAFPRAKLTLLGDAEQALFKDVETPESILTTLRDAFQMKRVRLISLNRSYRSTYPITTFAKSLLPDGDKIEAFNRPGDLPRVVIRYNEDDAVEAMLDVAREELKDQDTVAILTKNMVETKHVYQQLRPHIGITQISDNDRSLPKGLVVLPIYLAKGLEFDAVIAYNVSANNYPDAHLTGTLYTIASRAMHHLTLLSIGPVSPLISAEQMPKNILQIEHEFSNQKQD